MAVVVIHEPGGDRVVGLQQLVSTIGRGKANAVVVVDDPRVSLCHASVRRTAEGYVLRDEGSSNGTRVNGREVAEWGLADGDEIEVGSTSMTFRTRAFGGS